MQNDEEKFSVGTVHVELMALEANLGYRVYATIGDTPPIPVCDVDKAEVGASGNRTRTCKTKAEGHIRAALVKYNTAIL